MTRESFLSYALDEIEQRESRLLVWGIVDGYFEYDELVALLDPIVDRALSEGYEEFSRAEDAIDELLRLKLLAEVESKDGDSAYRSRMAETTRLLLRLRQLFPKHAAPGAWQRAPTLVADFRFQRRSRQYPRRDVAGGTAMERLASVTSDAGLLAAARVLISPNNPSFRLAGFQVRAAERIVSAIENDSRQSTIVCAGTGSGKTLAFYLPVLSSVARHRLADGNERPWVKAVAIYPRTELLKDQLREVVSRALALSEDFPGSRKPAIRIGALFGETPSSIQYCDWERIGEDRLCSFLRCIRCDAELSWRRDDVNAGRERLVCRACHWGIDGTTLPLTRASMRKWPPDILFTTTEMLNQRLSDNSLNHLFGVGANARRAPEIVLLDEVHTYEGRHGAQVAYLMRRWQRMADKSLRFVGLSATLREAPAFFAALTGTGLSHIEEIAPHSDEIENEGAEYLIALRGDPVSRAALLSTTIQTAMLIQRCLDPKTADLSRSVSGGFFGQRSFVFADNLDVINRLYFDLLSAEGRTSSGVADIRNAPNGGLAVLRSLGTSRSRYSNGQDWRFCESLGHQLSTRLVVERVSSQDRGIDAEADVVVATAALEVGFDDPKVGAVVQHKAPKGAAGFLQRKGRAGRTRGMRPWSAIVLSDYGRDRIAYQAYDLLFDPELPVRTLPLANRYITRMQAVFATMDYLGRRLEDSAPGSVWRDLAEKSDERRARQLEKEIRSILESENSSKRLADYLGRALKLSNDEVSALLWEYPRPLMTTVLPTALRRLTTRWRAFGKPDSDFKIRNNPLPEFVPATLFADLNLAEVWIALPHLRPEEASERPAMPVFAAIREFAPGRVSRRFGVRFRTDRHWIAPAAVGDLTPGAQAKLEIDKIGEHSAIGNFLIKRDSATISIQVFRPLTFTPVAPPANVADSSHAEIRWETQLVPRGVANTLRPAAGSLWSELVPEVGFYMHANQAPIEVRRFAVGSSAEIGLSRGNAIRLSVDFEHEGKPVGLGAAFLADGVVFKLRVPSGLYARQPGVDARKWQALRTARYLDSAWKGDSLRGVPSPFMREWLAQVFLSALTYEAISQRVSLAKAAEALAGGRASITLDQVLSLLFQSDLVDQPEEEAKQGGQDRLRKDLEDRLKDPAVVTELHRMARFLWEPITREWESWLRRAYQSTVAAALLRAITDLCPTVDTDDLCVDLDRGAILDDGGSSGEKDLLEIWITEKSPGGSGLVEEILRRYSEDPRRFFSAVRTGLDMGEFELIDHQLAKLLKVMVTEGSSSRVRELVEEFRGTANHEKLMRASSEMRVALVREGFAPFHGFLVSLANRLLRSGAGPAMDHYLSEVIERWNAEEERLGLEIDLRVMCYWLSQSEDIDAVVAEVGAPLGQDRGAWRMGAIYGLLWPRGRVVRQSALQLWNAFVELPPIERLLVADTMTDDRIRISVEDKDWFAKAAHALGDGALVTLTCSEAQRDRLGDTLSILITNPIDVGYLRAYARLQGLRRSMDVLEADIEVVEAVQ
ncbi:MAG: DEAD/DEAH box helicase [Betaproteobacteria bacterium]|nr:MAG: DEAD/DEAH box helicase [Betaproteobacteria bacterium]